MNKLPSPGQAVNDSIQAIVGTNDPRNAFFGAEVIKAGAAAGMMKAAASRPVSDNAPVESRFARVTSKKRF